MRTLANEKQKRQKLTVEPLSPIQNYIRNTADSPSTELTATQADTSSIKRIVPINFYDPVTGPCPKTTINGVGVLQNHETTPVPRPLDSIPAGSISVESTAQASLTETRYN